jgi:hypothetical protein
LIGVRVSGADFVVKLKTVNARIKHLDVEFAENDEETLVLIDFRPEIYYLDLTRPLVAQKYLRVSKNPHPSQNGTFLLRHHRLKHVGNE